MADYRWNTSDFAAAYDASAAAIHPFYVELQDAIIDNLPPPVSATGLVVDVGGGSGRLIERILDRRPDLMGIVVDQSEAFLALAERKLARFGSRAACIQARLQDDWPGKLPQEPLAIVSMSAIHHLDPGEKQAFYRRCYTVLEPGGRLLNGDEVRPADDAKYLGLLTEWTDAMRRGVESGSITPLFRDAIDRFAERNITRFGQPKASGDDCQETAEIQLDYLRSAGFTSVDVPWQRKLWALLRGMK